MQNIVVSMYNTVGGNTTDTKPYADKSNQAKKAFKAGSVKVQKLYAELVRIHLPLLEPILYALDLSSDSIKRQINPYKNCKPGVALDGYSKSAHRYLLLQIHAMRKLVQNSRYDIILGIYKPAFTALVEPYDGTDTQKDVDRPKTTLSRTDYEAHVKLTGDRYEAFERIVVQRSLQSNVRNDEVYDKLINLYVEQVRVDHAQQMGRIPPSLLKPVDASQIRYGVLTRQGVAKHGLGDLRTMLQSLYRYMDLYTMLVQQAIPLSDRMHNLTKSQTKFCAFVGHKTPTRLEKQFEKTTWVELIRTNKLEEYVTTTTDKYSRLEKLVADQDVQELFTVGEWLQPLPTVRATVDLVSDIHNATTCKRRLSIHTKIYQVIAATYPSFLELTRESFTRLHQCVVQERAFDVTCTSLLMKVPPQPPLVARYTHRQDTSDGFRDAVHSDASQNVDTTGVKRQCGKGVVGLLPHQAIAAHIAAPSGRAERLLLYHRVGTGKTQTIISILDQYYDDPRTKIVLCPNDELCVQFMDALKGKSHAPPNRYGLWLKRNRRQNLEEVRKDRRGGLQPLCKYEVSEQVGDTVLFHEGRGDYMPGPLLVWPLYRLEAVLGDYKPHQPATTGRAAGLSALEWPRVSTNFLDDKIIVIDEIHKLYEPQTDRFSMPSTGRLDRRATYVRTRSHLQTAQNSRIIGATATLPTSSPICMCVQCNGRADTKCTREPIANPYKDFVQMFTGGKDSLRGYLHMFRNTSQQSDLFPGTDDVRPVVTQHSDTATKEVCINMAIEDEGQRTAQLQRSLRKGLTEVTCDPQHLLDGHPMTNIVVKDFETLAPKISAMYKELQAYLREHDNNAIVLCDKKSGLEVVCGVLQKHRVPYMMLNGKSSKIRCVRASPTPGGEMVRTLIPFDDFDRRWRTECEEAKDANPIRVIVLNTETLSEGINILGVDIMFGLSYYPNSLRMEQAFGRADRLCRRDQFRGKPLDRYLLQRVQYSLEGSDGLSMLDKWNERTAADTQLYNNEAFKVSLPGGP